jgi:hypothetical protein
MLLFSSPVIDQGISRPINIPNFAIDRTCDQAASRRDAQITGEWKLADIVAPTRERTTGTCLIPGDPHPLWGDRALAAVLALPRQPSACSDRLPES